MFQTLLVDDDFLVRSYLKTLDSWEKECRHRSMRKKNAQKKLIN